MDNRGKRDLLARYVKGEVGLDWADVQTCIAQDGYGSDKTDDIVNILAFTDNTNDNYKIFSSALECNTDEGNQRFKQIFRELTQVIHAQVTDETKNKILERLLTTTTFTPNAPWCLRSGIARENHSQYKTEKSFSFLNQSISGNKGLELFDYLIRELPQDSRPQIVKDAVDSLHEQRSFNKGSGLRSIQNSLNHLIYIINAHSGNNLQANFQKLMGVREDGSYSKKMNAFFPREILESFPAEQGFTKMKEALGSSGITDDIQQNKYIKHFVKKLFIEDMIGGDQEKLKKLDHYIRKACNNRTAEIFEFKQNIVETLYNKKISCKLDEHFFDYILKKEDAITSKEIKNLIIYLGSTKKVYEELEKRGAKGNFLIADAIDNDCEFLRRVLQIGDKNLLNELIGGSQPLINKEQIFASVNFNAQNQSFQPIREALNKNQNSSTLNCLALLFSKLPDENKKTILNNLIPPIQQNQQAQGPLANQPINNPVVDNFLTDLLSRNLDSARMLIDLANKAELQGNTKSLLSHIINTGGFRVENGNLIEALNMIVDNGPLAINFTQQNTQISRELTGTELFNEVLRRAQFYNRQDSPYALLLQINPAALPLFFEKTGGVGTEINQQMIKKIYRYLNNADNQGIKNCDNCQNSLMFLLRRNPELERNFERFLITNDRKKIDDKKLIGAIFDSIFTEKNGEKLAKEVKSLADDFKELNINPLLEAGKIFQHFDDQNVRDEKTKISLAFGKSAVFKIFNKVTKKEEQLPPEVSQLIPLKLVGYEIGENNPLVNDATAKVLTSKLNERLLVNGFNPIRKPANGFNSIRNPANVPATAVGATGTSAVSQTPQSPTPS